MDTFPAPPKNSRVVDFHNDRAFPGRRGIAHHSAVSGTIYQATLRLHWPIYSTLTCTHSHTLSLFIVNRQVRYQGLENQRQGQRHEISSQRPGQGLTSLWTDATNIARLTWLSTTELFQSPQPPVSGTIYHATSRLHRPLIGWRHGSVVRTSVFNWWTFPDLHLIYDWRVTTSWVTCPLWVNKPGQLSLPSLWGR